ncbi:hypothetical protein D3C86_1315320 [compost metagenome]
MKRRSLHLSFGRERIEGQPALRRHQNLLPNIRSVAAVEKRVKQPFVDGDVLLRQVQVFSSLQEGEWSRFCEYGKSVDLAVRKILQRD